MGLISRDDVMEQSLRAVVPSKELCVVSIQAIIQHPVTLHTHVAKWVAMQSSSNGAYGHHEELNKAASTAFIPCRRLPENSLYQLGG
jgi:hypothetical protein